MQYRRITNKGTWRGPVGAMRLDSKSGRLVGRRRVVKLPPHLNPPFTLKSNNNTSSLRKRRIRNYNILRLLVRARRANRKFYNSTARVHDAAVGLRRTAIGRIQRLPKYYHGAVLGGGIAGVLGTGMYLEQRRNRY